jgi:hypothetical protein
MRTLCNVCGHDWRHPECCPNGLPVTIEDENEAPDDAFVDDSDFYAWFAPEAM